MGIISDTFRKMPDVVTGDGVFGISGWGRNANEVKNGLNHLLSNSGKALLLGVDIYKLTAMHYVEDYLPEKIRNMFKPTDEINKLYPPEEWMIETGEPAVKAWYKIQDMAFEKGLIKTELIGNSKCMLFDIWDVVGLYEKELKENPFQLYGLE